MPEMQTYEPGMFCWIELSTPDAAKSKEFYTSLFGWEAKEIPVPGGVYVMFYVGDKDLGAMMQNDKVPPRWLNFIAVASADDSAKRAGELGGKAGAPPFDVMDVGRMAMITDPQGATFALWEGRNHKGARVRDENNTLCWNELMTTDLEGAREFYKGLFDWNLKVSPEYTEIHVGEKPAGGLMQQPVPGSPSSWTPYLMVESVDATVDKAKSLGAQVYVQHDIPNVGRFAYLGDPQGAVFAVFTPAAR
jgi:predicted enzyme related to lactoylglutathione lyase